MRLKLLVMTLLLVSSLPALGQDSRDIDLYRLKPGPGFHDVLSLESARTSERHRWHLGGTVGYAHRPFRLVRQSDEKTAVTLVSSQWTADLAGSYGVFDWLEVGLLVPVVLQQDVGDASSIRPGLSEAISTAGLGDVRIHPKANVWHGDGYWVAASLPISFPTSPGGSFMGRKNLTLSPRVLAELDTEEAGTYLTSIGLILRGEERFLNLNQAASVEYGLGVTFPVAAAWSLFATLQGEVGLAETEAEEVPLEFLAGADWRLARNFRLRGGLGPGIGDGAGNPTVRFFMALDFRPPKRQPAVPVGDTDGDGILDDVDRCVAEAEDPDGFRDEDGCPDPDNDGDGIDDGEDQCVNVAEDLDGLGDEDGCPEEDFDQDGIVDSRDGCPSEPEDADGLADEDGCPEDDADRDGIADTADACPTEPETINGNKDEDGCPDEGVQRVIVEKGRIVILDKVYFASGKDTILDGSFSILNQVASVMRAHPELLRVRIDGHTDSQGSESSNLDLSKRRAASVKTYLLERGVEDGRLESEGFGEATPIETNDTREGRASNRRVEFTIQEQQRVTEEIEVPVEAPEEATEMEDPAAEPEERQAPPEPESEEQGASPRELDETLDGSETKSVEE